MSRIVASLAVLLVLCFFSYASPLASVLDRQWKIAIIWTGVAFILAIFGIIHVPEAGFESFSDATREQCEPPAVEGDPPVCWEFGEQWMFAVAYLMLAATFAILLVVSKYDETIEEPIDDESRHAFDDWFKDAAVDTAVDSGDKKEHHPDETTKSGKEFGKEEDVPVVKPDELEEEMA